MIAWQDSYWRHMVAMFPELERGESVSLTGHTHIPPQVFKQMARLTKKRQRIEAVLDGVNPFNAKGKADEIRRLLDDYIPGVEKMATTLNKYKAAFEDVETLEAENANLTSELDAANRSSVRKELQESKLHQEHRQARALLDRIPEEIKAQYASPTRPHKEHAK